MGSDSDEGALKLTPAHEWNLHFMYYGSRNLSLQFHPHALKFTLPCDVSGVKKYPIKYVLMYIVSRCD